MLVDYRIYLPFALHIQLSLSFIPHSKYVSHTSHSCIFSPLQYEYTYTHIHKDENTFVLAIFDTMGYRCMSVWERTWDTQTSTVFIDDIETKFRIYKLVVSKITFLHIHQWLVYNSIREKKREKKIKKRENNFNGLVIVSDAIIYQMWQIETVSWYCINQFENWNLCHLKFIFLSRIFHFQIPSCDRLQFQSILSWLSRM